ncbi:MAG TPA: preprotein translocase subunit YajC [Acidimicrobiales bacterium]|nr:preprotein translocase subunit YajC [Acidimicrobiales bacterium]
MFSHLNHVGLAVHGLALAATKTTKGSSSATLLLIVAFGLLVYLFVLRPRSQRMRRMQQQNQGAGIGDEIMLSSGIIGRVTDIEGDRATIEVAPEIEIEVVRRAISQVLSKAEDDVTLDVAPDPGYDADQHEHDDSTEDDEPEPDDGAGDEVDESSDVPSSKPGEPGPGAGLDLGREGRNRS